MESATSTTVFQDLRSSADNAEAPSNASEMESLCLNCMKDGTTRLLFTRLPYFREVVIMSFECPHCGWKNNELQPASTIQEQGCRYEVKCQNVRDLSRQVVKTECAEIRIPEIEFEISKQNGLITTIEGILDRASTGLQSTISRLKESDPGSVLKITEFISTLNEIKSGRKSFTFIVDDPSGNSFIESYLAPNPDPSLKVTHYSRSRQQNKLIGLLADDDEEDEAVGAGKEEQGKAAGNGKKIEGSIVRGANQGDQESPLDVDPNDLLKGEVLEFVTNCNNCNAPCMTRMKVTEIPHFKTVIIMATTCEACGTKTNEVKPGAGFEDKGVRITIHINDADKLNRDVVKSDSCGIEIPELDFELSSAGAGRYTTVEGLIDHMKRQLIESNPFGFGDSTTIESRQRLEALILKMDNMIGLTVIMDDPAGNSYCDGADEIVHYERTHEQNEELGINDMKVENY